MTHDKGGEGCNALVYLCPSTEYDKRKGALHQRGVAQLQAAIEAASQL